MPYAIEEKKAQRKQFVLLYQGTALEVIGKGIEEIAIEQGANIETTKDVLGNTESILDSYEKTTALDPIYVEGGVEFAEFLDRIEEEQLIDNDVKKPFVWVKLYKKDTTKFRAWKQDAIIELTSFGGGVKGVNAPCTLHWVGDRTYGSVSVTEVSGKKTYTFTADGEE